MRVKGITVQQIVLGLALIAALCWNIAQANEIKDLQLSNGAAGTRAELRLDTDVAYKTLILSQPHRFVVDLPGVKPGRNLQLPAPTGLVRAVRTGHPVPGTTRVVFELAAPVTVLKPRLESGVDGVRLVLEWPGDGPAPATITTAATAQTPSANPPATTTDKPAPTTTAAATVASAPPAGTAAANLPPVVTAKPPTATSSVPQTATAGLAVVNPATTAGQTNTAAAVPPPIIPSPTKPATAAVVAPPAPTPIRTQGTRPLIVAIDAGHGGQDPGAIGPTGKREKDVTLAIARELARQVNATPGLKAVLTRDSDMFLPLTRRTQLARQAKADIFISIHADAAENRNARGSSVYVLSLRGASSQRARWLADKENAADLIGGVKLPNADNTLASVLLDLTQSGQMRASEEAAGQVLGGLKDIGFNHKPHIERANFAVLRTSDMPAMLVETAFISNAEEEKRLVDPAYQRALARAVLAGVDTYFTRQPPPGTLYAARAQQKADRLLAEAKAGEKPVSAGGTTSGSAKAGGSPK